MSCVYVALICQIMYWIEELRCSLRVQCSRLSELVFNVRVTWFFNDTAHRVVFYSEGFYGHVSKQFECFHGYFVMIT